MAVRKVPDLGFFLPVGSMTAPSDRGKNSYQEL